mgnify:CR=1 FL=1
MSVRLAWARRAAPAARHLVLATSALFVLVPKGLFPQQDTGMILGTTEGPQDTSFPSMRERQERVLAVVATEP